ncbi:hypothetical protein [Rubritalea spongiae]|uniref:hypothetical protein n=1 Tax=Rubritalea spongiae TaxID=430797 RepID=UPI00366C8C73
MELGITKVADTIEIQKVEHALRTKDVPARSVVVRVVLVLLGLSSLVGAGKRQQYEAWYQAKAAAELGGKTEVSVVNGRVDILTDTHAIEVEFADKWKEAIGQALWYSMQTNKKAGIVLILEDSEKDYMHAVRLESAIKHAKLDMKVWLWPNDFTPQQDNE